jgi:hypothetical protein
VDCSIKFLSLCKENWYFINGFADWLSAIGTLAAVFISLYLALDAKAIKVKAYASLMQMVYPGSGLPPKDCIAFKVVNTGDRIVNIVNVSWKVGLISKRYFVQTFLWNPPPQMVSSGEVKTWFIQFDDGVEDWLQEFAKDVMMPNYRTSCRTLRVIFSSSIGREIIVKPDSSLTNRLMKICESLAKVKK